MPVRVLLLEMPQLLRGLLEHAIQRRSDWELLKSTRSARAVFTSPGAPPDIVVLGLTAAEDDTLVPAVFARWPQAQVMTVKEAGDEAVVYELRPRRRDLGQVSPDEMIDTLREAVARSRSHDDA